MPLLVIPLCVLVLFYAQSSAALEIVPVQWRGHQVLLATGPIVPGDAARFLTAIQETDPLPHGAKVVLLDSPGGSVDEALRISEILRSSSVHMVIPEGARCASACASIVFIAGKYRTIEEGGMFGQHSCSKEGVSDPDCNEIIAQHAFGRGVSHGSVAAFVTFVAPEDILWMGREDVDCWGISRYPFTEESGFGKSEPCPMGSIFGRMPDAQAAWRVDFLSDGYRAFLRPVHDHVRELELGLFCDERQPGQLFLSMDIMGPSNLIANAITQAYLTIDARPAQRLSHYVVQEDPVYSRVNVPLPRSQTLEFLQSVDSIELAFDVRQPYEPVGARTVLSGSRKALIFAANHCIQK